jgi:hypothetical protein
MSTPNRLDRLRTEFLSSLDKLGQVTTAALERTRDRAVVNSVQMVHWYLELSTRDPKDTHYFDKVIESLAALSAALDEIPECQPLAAEVRRITPKLVRAAAASPTKQ